MGEVEPADYTDAFGRLSALILRINREGRTPALLAAKVNLELEVGNLENATNAAREFLAVAESEPQKKEARYMLVQCVRKEKAKERRLKQGA